MLRFHPGLHIRYYRTQQGARGYPEFPATVRLPAVGPPADTISPRLAVYFGPLVPPRLRSADGYGSELCWWFEVKEFLVIEVQAEVQAGVQAGVQAEVQAGVQAGHCPGFEGNRGTATEREEHSYTAVYIGLKRRELWGGEPSSGS